MGKFASGKHAIAISDRSGLRFPYTEMVKEWNGMWVHYSEYEPKQPQLELAVIGPEAIALQHPRPEQRSTVKVPAMLPENPFTTYSIGTSTILVHSPNHGRNTETVVRFRGSTDTSTSSGPSGWPITPANGAPAFSDCLDFDGITGANICKTAGYTITVGRLTGNSTTLASDITSTTTSVTLTNGSAFKTTSNKSHQVAVIGSELIRYTTITDNVLGEVSPQATAINPNVVTRGAYGSTKAAHTAGASVINLVDSDDWFYFTVDTDTATVGNIQGGGFPVSAGPVTITP